MIDMVVTQRVNAGMEKDFEAIVRQLEADTLAHDQGCLRYEWYRATEPQTFVLIERWTDEASVQAHLKSPHFMALMPKLRACVPENFRVMPLNRLS